MKAGNSITVWRGGLCSFDKTQEMYTGGSMNVLCSWPKAEKVLAVNNVPVVYFGRTNDNKPMYWSMSAEVKPDSDIGTVEFDRHYELIQTGDAAAFSAEGHWEKKTAYYVSANGDVPFLILADYWNGVGTIVGTETVDVFIPDATSSVDFSKLFRDEHFTATADSCTFSIWRDAAGVPLNSVKQRDVLPPEHKSEHRLKIQKALYHYETVRNGVIFDCVWAELSGASVRIVDFSVTADASGIVVKAEPHLSSERRRVFSYLDVLDWESVKGVNCEVKDWKED